MKILKDIFKTGILTTMVVGLCIAIAFIFILILEAVYEVYEWIRLQIE